MNANNSPRHRLWGTLLFAYWAALFVGTHIPLRGVDLPGADSDKFIHAAAYAGLALLVCCFSMPTPPGRWRKMLAILLALAAYGGLDELLQYLVAGRSPAVADWVADVLGVCLGLAAYAAIDACTARRP